MSNYAFNPIAEQALRPNQTIVPQRVNAALGPGMSTNWDELAEQYQELIVRLSLPLDGAQVHAANEAVKRLVGVAASSIPRNNPTALAWFISSLQRVPQKWFVARVMAIVTPLPSPMIDHLLFAALLEPNPSANRIFIEPCVRAVGALEVASRVAALAERPGVAENCGVEMVMYWVHRAGA